MRSGYLALLAGLLSATATAATEPAVRPHYVEVTGRLENLKDYRSTNDPDDLIGHGWMTARLHVTRVWSGPRLPRVVTVRYFGHNYLQDGKRIRLKLRRDDEGAYLVCVPVGSSGVQCP